MRGAQELSKPRTTLQENLQIRQLLREKCILSLMIMRHRSSEQEEWVLQKGKREKHGKRKRRKIHKSKNLHGCHLKKIRLRQLSFSNPRLNILKDLKLENQKLLILLLTLFWTTPLLTSFLRNHQTNNFELITNEVQSEVTQMTILMTPALKTPFQIFEFQVIKNWRELRHEIKSKGSLSLSRSKD